jgi:anti-sigma B factor antagonist
MVVRVGPRGARWERSAGHVASARTESNGRFDSGTSVVSVSGELDLTTAPALEQTLLGVADDRTDDVIVDLTGCTFLDSQGLRALIATKGQLECSSRRLAVVVSNPSVLRIFQITQLDEPFRIYRSLGAAGDGNGNGNGAGHG